MFQERGGISYSLFWVKVGGVGVFGVRFFWAAL